MEDLSFHLRLLVEFGYIERALLAINTKMSISILNSKSKLSTESWNKLSIKYIQTIIDNGYSK